MKRLIKNNLAETIIVAVIILLSLTYVGIANTPEPAATPAAPRSGVDIAWEFIQNVTACPGVAPSATGEVPEIAALVPDWNTAVYRHAWLIECEEATEYHWITWHYDQSGTSIHNIKSIKVKEGQP